MSSSSQISHFRQKLQELDNYKLDERFGHSSKFDESQVEQYRQSRDEYLERRKKILFLKHAQTFETNNSSSGNDTDDVPFDVPSVDDALAVEEEHAVAERELVQAIRNVRDHLQVLRRDEGNLHELKQDVECIIQEAEDQHRNEPNQPSLLDESMSIVTMEKEEDDVDEETLAAEQLRLTELQTRKAELLRELEAKEEANIVLEASLAQAPKLFDPFIDVGKLEIETESAKKTLEQGNEFRAFYNSMAATVSKLSGVEIHDITETEENNTVLNLCIHGSHEVLVTLKPNKFTYRLVDAEFRTPLRLEAPSANNVLHSRMTVVNIPDPSDLVLYAQQNVSVGDDIRFVINGISERIEAAEERLQELIQLQRVTLAKVGPTSNTAKFQEIVCSLKDIPLSIVLRMTIDCPVVPGSVTVDQILGNIGGWDTNLLRELNSQASNQVFQRPTTAIQWVENKVKESGATIPNTPKLPTRNIFRE